MSISESQAGQTGERAMPWQRVHDRYRIVRELGVGAFGTVFLAEDEQTAQRVAIRVLPRAASTVPNVARIIRNTSRSIMATAVSHPSLVGVLEVGEVEPGRISVVTELVEGRRLSEILAAGKSLDFDSARQCVLDLGGAIEVLHNLGLVHGAIRPRNVMVLADGRVKLMDVELAGLRDTPALHDDTALAEYLAPEQIKKGPWTEKTDSYAFGLLVYDVFCGGPPFQASSREAVLAKQLTEAPTPMRRRRSVPASVESIVRQALEKDHELRPWMHEMLNGLWGEASAPATATGAGTGSVGWKRPAVFVGSAIAAAAAVVLAIWGLSGLQSSSERPTASAPTVPVAHAPASVRALSNAVARPESSGRPPALAAAAAPPPAVVPGAAAKPTPPTAPAPGAAVALPTNPPTPDARAGETPTTTLQIQIAPAPVPRATPPDTRQSAGTAAVARGATESGPAMGAESQLERRTYRVGWLDPGRVSTSYQDIVREALVGYPRHITFEYRYAGGRIDRLPELAADLVQLKVDVVFAVGNQASQAARQATSKIPIVIVGSDASGGNVTGVTYSSPDLARGWLKLLKEMRPSLRRVAVVFAADASSRGERASIQTAAANAGVTVQAYPLHEGDALGSLLARPDGERAEAIIVPGGPGALVHLARLVELAKRVRIPTVYGSAEFADAGGLIAYGPSTPAIYRRAGAYIGKILGPANPQDLPIEQPSRSELVVNLRTARALGLSLPESLILRADRVLP